MFRRTFIGLATTSGLALAGFGLIGRSKAKLNDGVEIGSYINSQSMKMRNELINYFEAHAYRPVQPLPLVTGVEFNGGLEFDDDTSQMGSNEYCIQASARVDDIDEKNKPGTLPLFHIIALSSAGGVRPNQNIDLSLKFIVDQLGLVPSRLRVTGTKNLLAHLPLLEKYGLQESQIRLVDFNDARAAGKGSGYFEPKGHPRSPSFETYSIEYVMPNGQEIEIAEIGLDGTGLGLGIERLTMARHNQLLNWTQGLNSFRDAVQASAKRQSLPLPKGYYEILELSQPT